MANLEVKSKISTTQFGVFLAAIILGTQFIGLPAQLVPKVGQFAWVSVILGGILFFGAAWIILKLAAFYPDKDFTEYLPRLLGKWLGLSVIALLIVWDFILICVGQSQFSKILAFYMFDRTPPDVIAMSMIAVMTYNVLQDLGTLLRVAQFTFMVSIIMINAVWSAGIFNFQPENLMPFTIDHPIEILKAALITWPTFSGFEIILLLYPLISQKHHKIVKTVGASFIFVTLISLFIVVMTIGVLSVETVKTEAYPTMVTVRSVELPGTFIERLENYFLIAWIPLIFNSHSLLCYMMVQVMTNLWGFADHRPWALVIMPLVYTGITLLDGLELVQLTGKVVILLGGSFSLGIMPLVYLYAKWKNQGVSTGVSSD